MCVATQKLPLIIEGAFCMDIHMSNALLVTYCPHSLRVVHFLIFWQNKMNKMCMIFFGQSFTYPKC